MNGTIIKLLPAVIISACLHTSCKGPVGPVGPDGVQGESGEPGLDGSVTHYPIHRQKIITGSIIDGYYYLYGYQFDTEKLWIMSSTVSKSFYDIAVEIGSKPPFFTAVSIGQNTETRLYVLEEVKSFGEITSFPDMSARRSRDETIAKNRFYLIKTKLNRWAKLRISILETKINENVLEGQSGFDFEILFEYYYYKDKSPDFTLHK